MSTHESENWVGKSKQVWRHLTIHTLYTVGALFHSAAVASAATAQPRPTPIDSSIRVRKYLTLSNAHIYMKIEIEKMATKK